MESSFTFWSEIAVIVGASLTPLTTIDIIDSSETPSEFGLFGLVTLNLISSFPA